MMLNVFWLDLLGYCGALFVIAAFFMTTMIPLRVVAIISNVLFVVYGYFSHAYPILTLYSILLPINIYKLIQIKRVIRDVQIPSIAAPSFHNILSLMHKRTVPKGEVLMKKGEYANSLYYIKEGFVEIMELNLVTTAGDVVGEMGLFTPDRKRTATVTAKTDCILYELTESQLKQLYFQDPSFAFSVIQIVINRLLQNMRRLDIQLKEKSK